MRIAPVNNRQQKNNNPKFKAIIADEATIKVLEKARRFVKFHSVENAVYNPCKTHDMIYDGPGLGTDLRGDQAEILKTKYPNHYITSDESINARLLHNDGTTFKYLDKILKKAKKVTLEQAQKKMKEFSKHETKAIDVLDTFIPKAEK